MEAKYEIDARQAEMAAAVRGGNASAVAAIYAEDCHFMPHSNQPGRGRKAVEAYMKRDFAEGVKSVTINSHEVKSFGDYACECGTYKLDGVRGVETGSFMYIWKKVDGKWYIYADCFNVIDPAKG